MSVGPDREEKGARPERVFLVDGHGLAYRAFYALIRRPLRTTYGENTSVAWAVTQFIRKLVREHAPDYLVFVFDAGRGVTFRHQIYEPYKITREKLAEADADEFKTSLRRLHQILEAMRIPVIEIEGYEADDVIGTLARQAADRGLQAVIVSGDLDFYQLIGPRIAVVEPGRKGRVAIEPQWVDEAAATERLGVAPRQVVDYLALIGDPSDNIPGVRGIGPKNAEALLVRFGSLEEILARLDEIESKRVRQALWDYERDARLSKELVTIRTDVPVALDLDHLRVREPDREKLRRLFLELEFHSLVRELAPEREEDARYEVLEEAAAWRALMDEAARRGRMTIEVIRDREGPRGDAPAGVAVALEAGRAFYLPLTGSGSFEADSEPVRALERALASDRIEKIGHDVKRLLLSFRRAGMPLSGRLTDTMLAAYCLDPARRQYDLESQVIERFGHRLAGEAEAGRARAAAERADLVGRLAERLLQELDELGQRKLYEDIEIPLVPVLADMEWAGIAVDGALFEKMSGDLEAQLDRVRREIYELAGGELNIDSPPQLREVLFKKLKLPVVKRTKTGPSTDADVLRELAPVHGLPARILEYRELSKLKSTYVDGLLALIDPVTGRLHTSFNQAVTATGRLSSSDPNLQNVPIRTELGASIRKGFVPSAGWRMLVADYSQIELRILAHLSKDPAFLDAFRSGRDVHRETAARVFDVDLARVSPAMREAAKTVNYATLYGQGAVSLSRQLGISEAAARKFIDSYFERFSAIRTQLDRQIERARSEGYVETIFGRRRYVPELRSRNPRIRGFGERVALNTPVQGSAADIIKLAMIRIHGRLAREGLRSRMLLQVHDELLFETPEEEVEASRVIACEEMERVVELEVPLVAEVGIGESWYDAKRG